MMDHARHLSSPSPTSPFLFHHSESRPFKSTSTTTGTTKTSSSSSSSTSSNGNDASEDQSTAQTLLTPLLSSAVSTDVSNVDECFITNAHHNSQQHHGNNNSNNISVLQNHSNGHHNSFIEHQLNHNNSKNCHADIDRVDSLSCVDHGGDEEDEDDEDAMHNMLSGSSTSSTSTMPLLTESHSHHSFSRISLEEYSPLSLVEDCDNALQPISPTSLACGHHHSSSFKTSLNELKMDNLVGDVGSNGVDHDGVDVNDARSLSPTLLSSLSLVSNNHHNNLWSNNSSTAITQNTSLLNSSSASFLLSHHHHNHHQHQLNSLMQQLEPQSLDEAPPLIQQSNLEMETLAAASTNRPSSEPPQGCDTNLTVGESKSMMNEPTRSKPANASSYSSSSSSTMSSAASSTLTVKDSHSKLDSNASNSSTMTPLARNANRSRKSRSRANTSSASANSKQQQQPIVESKNSKCNVKLEVNQADGVNNKIASKLDEQQSQQSVNSSKAHLQLNHHKKLRELQQRLFGTPVAMITDANPEGTNKSCIEISTTSSLAKTGSSDVDRSGGPITSESNSDKKQEPDSSAGNKDETPESSKVAAIARVKSRACGTRVRRSRAKSDDSSQPLKKTKTVQSSCSSSTTSTTQESSITSESAEPDTTTKSSDCVKLADLSSLNDSINQQTNGNNNHALLLSDQQRAQLATSEASSDTGLVVNEKRVQQIQLVSPSLTVVANSGLMQSIGVQQQNGGSVLAGPTSCGQILCRPQAIITTTGSNLATMNGSLKGFLSNELLKSGETVLTNWSIQANNNNQTGGTNSNSTNVNSMSSGGQQTNIGAHQIAIQVICQDGTSLVLPVSSTAGLNAVSLTPQHQMQSVLTSNNTGSSLQNRNSNNGTSVGTLNFNNSNINNAGDNTGSGSHNQLMMPIQNIATQHPMVNNPDNKQIVSAQLTSTGNAINTNQQPTSGLAASSPTLAALLDASSNRTNDLNNSINFANQNFVSTNLLRKLVSGNRSSADVKAQQQQQNSIGLANCNSLVTVCAPNNSAGLCSNSNNSNASQLIFNGNNNKNVTITASNKSDTQGLIVATGNEKGEQKQAIQSGNPVCNSDTNAQQQQKNLHTTSTKNGQNHVTVANANTKQSKMGSSTGNRQVDPTQPFRCEHCNSTFTRLGNFTRHKKIHTVPTKDGQRFKCDVCSKSFLQRCDLARHLHIHRGTEPHRCNICGKGYIRHSDLVTHQRFHNKEKPFGCPHCSKGFCQRGDLNRHLRSIHLQMKPILCPCCNRKFAKQETLLRHLNTAHRSKPNVTGTATIVTGTDIASNYNMGQSEDKQTTVSVVTTTGSSAGGTLLNNCVETVQKSINEADNESATSVNSLKEAKIKGDSDPNATVAGISAVKAEEHANSSANIVC